MLVSHVGTGICGTTVPVGASETSVTRQHADTLRRLTEQGAHHVHHHGHSLARILPIRVPGTEVKQVGPSGMCNGMTHAGLACPGSPVQQQGSDQACPA